MSNERVMRRQTSKERLTATSRLSSVSKRDGMKDRNAMVEPEFDLEAFGGQEVERQMDERAQAVEEAVAALHGSLTDLNYWKNDVTASSALPTNVLTRLTVISSHMLRTKAQVLDAFGELVTTARSLAPRAMMAELQQQRAETKSAREEARRHYIETQDHKQRSDLYDKQLIALKWYNLYSRLRAKRQRVRHARNLGSLQKQIRELEQRLAMHNVRRLAINARVEANDAAAELMGEHGMKRHEGLGALQEGISSALNHLKNKAKRGHAPDPEALAALSPRVPPGGKADLRSKTVARGGGAWGGANKGGGLLGGLTGGAGGGNAVGAGGGGAGGKQLDPPRTPIKGAGSFTPITFVLPAIPDVDAVEAGAASAGGSGAATARGVAGEAGGGRKAGGGGESFRIPEPLTLPAKDSYTRTELLEVRLQHTKQLHALQGAFEERLQNVTDFYKYKLQQVRHHAANKSVLPFTPVSPIRGSASRGHSMGGSRPGTHGAAPGTADSSASSGMQRKQLRIHSHRFLYPADSPSYKDGVDHINELEVLTAGLPMELELQPHLKSQKLLPPELSTDPSLEDLGSEGGGHEEQ